MKALDLTGQRFGMLAVLAFAGHAGIRREWRCLCDCGNACARTTATLRRGTQSCGCLQRRANLQHGHARDTGHSPEYTAWSHMIYRCDNPNHPQFKDWGGRGIRVCRRWRKFANFLSDMGPRPPGRNGKMSRSLSTGSTTNAATRRRIADGPHGASKATTGGTMYRERISTLKYLSQSPAHYWHARNNPRAKSPAMIMGSLVHALVLGGKYYVFEGDVRRGKAWDAFEAETAGKWARERSMNEPEEALIVRVSEMDQALRIAKAVTSDPIAAPLLIGEKEKYIEFELDGRPFRSTLDVLGDTFVNDLKTSASASPDLFPHVSRRLNYPAQMAVYDAAACASVGRALRRSFLTVVETSAPFAVTVFQLTPAALEQGRKSVRLWNERAIQCEAENAWPGYCQSIVDLDTETDMDLMFGDDDNG